jgi:hypothetical protein
MRVDDLQDGQVVRARWGRAGRAAPNWGPWQDVALYVQRHMGKVVCVTLRDISWAEGDARDLVGPDEWQKNAYFVVEDYYLEIEGLTR